MSKIFRFVRNPTRFVKRNETQSSSNGKDWKLKLRKFAFNWSVYNKYGLYTHDIIDAEHPIVHEALRRLPKEVLNARNFRLMRGMQLDAMKIYLPKEKWTTFEEDMQYRYLDLYIQELIEEKREIYEFGCANYYKYDWPYGQLK